MIMRNSTIEEKKEEVKEKEIICVGCPKGCRVTVRAENDEIFDITGYDCDKGREYAVEEFKNPTRILPTTVKVKNGELPLVPVKTDRPVPRSKLISAMKVVAEIVVEAPVEIGDIIVRDILNTGANLVATAKIKERENI
ncbi:MAG: DUF1667 domain-containing protein [Bacillota bacterium]